MAKKKLRKKETPQNAPITPLWSCIEVKIGGKHLSSSSTSQYRTLNWDDMRQWTT